MALPGKVPVGSELCVSSVEPERSLIAHARSLSRPCWQIPDRLLHAIQRGGVSPQIFDFHRSDTVSKQSTPNYRKSMTTMILIDGAPIDEPWELLMTDTLKNPAVAGEPVIPLHIYLSKKIDECEDLTNVEIARRLGYTRPNVIAMIRTGAMKLPFDKVPALAQVLGLDPLALLRRVMVEYAPEQWATMEKVIGQERLVTRNEAELLRRVRGLLHGDDLALTEDGWFTVELTASLLAALDRRARATLAHRKTGRSPRDSKAAKANAAMLDLLQRQAAERTKLMRSFGSGPM